MYTLKNEVNKIFPTKSKLLLTFLSCMNWEEKYIYTIDLGKLLPIFPKGMQTKKFLLSGCQSQTWIAITSSFSEKIQTFSHHRYSDHSIKLYGDSDSSIVKGIIAIIFILYQGLTLQEIIHFNAIPFLEKLQLQQHLTTSRSQGVKSILHSIHIQAENLKNNISCNLYK